MDSESRIHLYQISLMQLTSGHNGSLWRRVQNIVLCCLHRCELEVQVMIVFCTKLQGSKNSCIFFLIFFPSDIEVEIFMNIVYMTNEHTNVFPQEKSLTWEGQYISYTQVHGFRGKRPNPN